jgi:hypothetical protein
MKAEGKAEEGFRGRRRVSWGRRVAERGRGLVGRREVGGQVDQALDGGAGRVAAEIGGRDHGAVPLGLKADHRIERSRAAGMRVGGRSVFAFGDGPAQGVGKLAVALTGGFERCVTVVGPTERPLLRRRRQMQNSLLKGK